MADKYEYSDKYKTPVFRGAFVRVFDGEPITNQDGSPVKNKNGQPVVQWGLTAIFPQGTDTKPLKAAMVEAARKAWGDQAATKLKHPKFRHPLRDGADMVNKDGDLYEGFEAGQVVVKIATKNRKPGIVDAGRTGKVRPIVGADGTTLVDKDNDLREVVPDNEVFSGCWFKATVHAMAYDRSDGFGISFKLENLQLVRQDERLGGGGAARAEDDFAEDAMPAPAATAPAPLGSGDDLDDILGAA